MSLIGHDPRLNVTGFVRRILPASIRRPLRPTAIAFSVRGPHEAVYDEHAEAAATRGSHGLARQKENRRAYMGNAQQALASPKGRTGRAFPYLEPLVDGGGGGGKEMKGVGLSAALEGASLAPETPRVSSWAWQ